MLGGCTVALHSCLNAASQVVSQVGTEGEEQAADYLYRQVQQLAEQAAASRPDLTAEAARESVRVVCLCRWLLLPAMLADRALLVCAECQPPAAAYRRSGTGALEA